MIEARLITQTMHNGNNLGIAIIESACSPESRELLGELGEFEIDAFLDDGLIKEIPVIRTFLAFWKSSITLKDRLFLRKVASFIAATPRFSSAEINHFMIEHWSDKAKAQRLGATVLLVLERLDDLEKPAMLARVFAAFVRGHINSDAFRRLAAGIDRSSVEDLKVLAGEPSMPESLAEPYPFGLVRSGFARLSLHETAWSNMEFQAVVSNLGLMFQKCILNEF
ncbi:MAG: hypothetical protein MN733_17405 [Nitrososphaera sp.]|nr:hypothetical protein [Nitrososphaera sp.]